MEKKGMSTVVTVLVVILLTIVILGILWMFVKNYVEKQSELVEIKQKFFTERVEIVELKLNEYLTEISVKKIGGEIEMIIEGEEGQGIISADVISVVDLSGSMRACHGVWGFCCYFTLDGSYYSNNCYGLLSDRENDCTSTCSGAWVDRITPLQDANKELINAVLESENNKLGLVGYNNDVDISASMDLTDNKIELNNKIDSWEARGSTCLCCGINEATTKLEQQSQGEKVKTMIVMSDGDSNIGCGAQGTGDPIQDAIQAACDANQRLTNLTIYSVGVGDSIDEATLTAIAECGNGEYFSAIDINDLTEIYQTVADKLKITQKSVHQFNYLAFIFYSETDSYKEIVSELPGSLETKKYNFDLTGKLEGEIIKIEVYPIIISGSGKEIIGPLLDFWEKN